MWLVRILMLVGRTARTQRCMYQPHWTPKTASHQKKKKWGPHTHTYIYICLLCTYAHARHFELARERHLHTSKSTIADRLASVAFKNCKYPRRGVRAIATAESRHLACHQNSLVRHTPAVPGDLAANRHRIPIKSITANRLAALVSHDCK